jgi:RNA polymerase sigma factor (sigma-70 family)
METLVLQPEATTSGTATFEGLYEAVFPVVAKLVRKWNGSFEDAKDIFHDGLVVLYEKEHSKDLSFNISREAYLVGICKHLWMKKHARDASRISLDDMESAIEIPQDFYPTVNTGQLLQFLEVTSKRCLDLLSAFYFQVLPVKKVARLLGYSSEHSVSVQKYKCLEGLRNQVKEKSITYEDFLE